MMLSFNSPSDSYRTRRILATGYRLSQTHLIGPPVTVIVTDVVCFVEKFSKVSDTQYATTDLMNVFFSILITIVLVVVNNQRRTTVYTEILLQVYVNPPTLFHNIV